MSFLKRIIDYFKPDPTRNWREVPQRTLTFTIPNRTVNGTAFGHSFESLETFGKPGNESPVYDRVFNYLEHGFIVELQEDEKIDFFGFVFRNDTGENFTEARASVVKGDGATLVLSKSSSMADITAFMGEPKSIDEDEEEVILFYQIDDLRIEWELTLTKFLKRVNVFPSSKNIT